ncbi:MAG: hypothetical protein ACOCYP_02670, partial [Planctomycetota bacterium]
MMRLPPTASLLPVLLFLVACGGGHPSDADKASPAADLTTVSLYVGGEKMALLHNPKMVDLLARKHGLKLDAIKAGSVEMARQLNVSDKDAIWPSNDVAVEFFKMRGGESLKDDIIFNSPIVIYTGWNITNALIQQGIVEKRTEGYFIVRFRKLLELIVNRTAWKDLGLDFFGTVTVRCTDPTKSNSGNMFSGLVATMFNEGRLVTDDSVQQVLPQLQSFFTSLGMMEHSSGDIFKKFIATGINNSMVVGYENQIVEFIIEHDRHKQLILDSVCILYPKPTVWSSHPVIALSGKGKRLIDALKDEEIQDLAW